jgi:single-strand DNA-binding protein
MPNFNRVILMGNLTADPELRYTQDGTPVCSLRMAINEFYTTPAGEKKQDVIYVPVTVWRKQAETCAEYLKKGRPVMIEGKLKLNQWTTPEGQKRSNLEVVGLRVQFLGTAPGQGREKGAPEADVSHEPAGPVAGPEEEAEDIPF